MFNGFMCLAITQQSTSGFWCFYTTQLILTGWVLGKDLLQNNLCVIYLANKAFKERLRL